MQAIWADGSPLEPSESSLYISDGGKAWRLPSTMTADRARPILVR